MPALPAHDDADVAPPPPAESFLSWVDPVPPLPEVRARLAAEPNAHLAIGGLWGPARSLSLAALTRAAARRLCVITPTQTDAERVTDTLSILYGPDAIALFPAREYLPAGEVLPVDDNTGDRLTLLKALLADPCPLRAIVAPVHALMQTLAPPAWLRDRTTWLRRGAELAPDALAHRLVAAGFERVTQVERPGEISLRGGIFDIFAPCQPAGPTRIEFFGDDIDSIRQFDVGTQISHAHLDELAVLPRVRSVELASETLGAANLATLVDYLPADTLVGWWEPRGIEAEHERLIAGDILSVEQAPWRKLSDLVRATATWPSVAVAQTGIEPALLPVEAHWEAHTAGLQRYARDLDAFWPSLKTWRERGQRVALFANSIGEADRLDELCREHGLTPERRTAPDPAVEFQIALGRLHAGVDWPEAGWILVSEQELYGRYVRRRTTRRFHAGTPIGHYTDLRVGDYVVHTEHGIGIYRGLQYLAEAQTEFLVLEYQEGDKLYVPIDQLDLVQRYVGGGIAPTLHKLGGTTWQKTKARVQRAIRELAGELVELYAARQAKAGFAFPADTDWQRDFEAAFEFELTEDQRTAIAATKADMESPHPMDRLICGDVGYGKTEVALRAIFKAVLGGKQAAVLVPTTVLAQQHFQNFTARMAEYPVRLALLSRMQSPAQIQATLNALAAGTVDVVIGTHRLVQRDVSFRNLGLAVIDEEQRFGVTHKERLKQLRTQVDVLTLTATPIPRTLHLSLMGARDLSLVNTPPPGRLPIVTTVDHYDPTLVRDAIRRELAREGQVFVVHNRVQTIAGFAEELRALVPEARLDIAHGQMKARELEDVMMRFLAREFDVLVSTTIIESGLDMPNVNTIVIDRADRFGLAQLYQLRGRVGRYTHRAYAHLLLPPHQRITRGAEARLEAIREFANLGAGLSLALRDLEIRGAGNLLGAEQSGEISAIGFDLYCQLIAGAVKQLHGQPEDELTLPRVDLGVPAFIPDEYVVSPLQKLGLYKRLTLLRHLPDVMEFARELTDRYGPLPDPLIHLLRIAEIRILAAAAGLEFVGRIAGEIVFRCRPEHPLPADTLQRLSGTYGRLLRCEMGAAMKLLLPITPEVEPKLVPLVRRVAGDLPDPAVAAAAGAR